jgi:superfamily II DNA/RNA helicase
LSDDKSRSINTIGNADVMDFEAMGIQSPVLLRRIQTVLKLSRPSAIQVAAFRAISQTDDMDKSDWFESFSNDVIVGSETGSGKTLAYLLPLMDDILQHKAAAAAAAASGTAAPDNLGYDYARALILVPNKELVQQVVRMALGLAGGPSALVYGGRSLPDTSLLLSLPHDDETAAESELVRLAILPGGLREPLDFVPFRQTRALTSTGTQPPIDLLISTPAAVAPLGLSPKNIAMFADIQTIVMDEADLLLDGGYIRPLQDVLLGFRRADRLHPTVLADDKHRKTQHVFVAATLPDSGLRSVDAYLTKRFPSIRRIALDNMHLARHSGLQPEQATIWLEQESKRERLRELVRLLESELSSEKVMVFLNSVDDVEASCEALQRACVSCLPYHAKIPLDERSVTLNRFRMYSSRASGEPRVSDENDDNDAIPVLVCTDLASRGLDIPGVTVVVQLQFAGNVVSHLHRMGRCGRALPTPRGRGIVFYSPHERALVATVQAAESMQTQAAASQSQQLVPTSRLTLTGDVTDEAMVDLEPGVSAIDAVKARDSVHPTAAGKVTTAFSRKRGFTKKLKKNARRQADALSFRNGGNEPM